MDTSIEISTIFLHNTINTTNATYQKNWTFEDMKKLNDVKVEALIPVMILLGTYMLVGITGNALVCYVMGFKLKMNTQDLLIIYLAVFDLINCIVCIPANILDMRQVFYFPPDVTCKIVSITQTFTCEASILTLLVIASDRYRQICKPTKRQMSLRYAKLSLIIILLGALLLSWPSLIMWDIRTTQTGIPGIARHNCKISNSLKGTLYASTLFVLFIGACVVLIVLYTCILLAVRRLSNRMPSISNHNPFKHPSVNMKRRKTTGNYSVTITTEDTNTTTTEETCDSEIENEKSSADMYKSQCYVHNQTSNSCMVNSERTFSHVGSNTRPHTTNTEMNDCHKQTEHRKTLTAINEATQPSDTIEEDNSKRTQKYTISVIGGREVDNSSHQNTQTMSACSENTKKIRDNSDSPDSFNRKLSINNMNTVIFNKEEGNLSTKESSNYEIHNRGSKAQKQSLLKTSKLNRKIAVIAFLVTLVFILSYMPFLSLQISKQIVKRLDYNLTGAALVFFEMAQRSFYINSFLNPIIYGILNNRFRRELRILLKTILPYCFREESQMTIM